MRFALPDAATGVRPHALWHKHVHNVELDPIQCLKMQEMDEHPNTVDFSCRRTGKTAVKEMYHLEGLATTPHQELGIVAPRMQQSQNNLNYLIDGVRRSEILTAFIAHKQGRPQLKDTSFQLVNGSKASAYGITIQPITDMGGRFKNPATAWEQRDVMTGATLSTWAAWQMSVARLDPDNFDDLGSMGRPFLDSCAHVWRKLTMTEEDLVMRRRMRAPLRMAHVLEGADDVALDAYRKQVEGEQGSITTDYYLNRKGGVQAVQGDATLGDIGDVVHLLDTFYAGSPAPKGLFGYTDGMARDILEDLKRSYYDEVDAMQDAMASSYAVAFRIHLLFKGIDPGVDEFTLRYAQRRTETPNQVADLALKYMSLGLPDDMVYADMGLDPDYVRTKRIEQAERNDPYPPAAQGAGGRVSVTPGNAPKGESATAVSQAGGNGGKGRQ